MYLHSRGFLGCKNLSEKILGRKAKCMKLSEGLLIPFWDQEIKPQRHREH